MTEHHHFSHGEFWLGMCLAVLALAFLFTASLWLGGNR